MDGRVWDLSVISDIGGLSLDLLQGNLRQEKTKRKSPSSALPLSLPFAPGGYRKLCPGSRTHGRDSTFG